MGRPRAEILVDVRSADEQAFVLAVRVREGDTETAHDVSLGRDLLARLARRVSAESAQELVRRSFEFLLQREPKESILRRFDLSVIGRYFPEFEATIGQAGR
ncbi:MAG TPA: hypothetical protein VE987_02080 [Polyangiaceae bacterium]|nr:hypothetical protein [Polyangiaceae bacterium]